MLQLGSEGSQKSKEFIRRLKWILIISDFYVRLTDIVHNSRQTLSKLVDEQCSWLYSNATELRAYDSFIFAHLWPFLTCPYVSHIGNRAIARQTISQTWNNYLQNSLEHRYPKPEIFHLGSKASAISTVNKYISLPFLRNTSSSSDWWTRAQAFHMSFEHVLTPLGDFLREWNKW